MIIKINQAQGRKIVAICDEDILGKVFVEDGMQLDLSSPFYQGLKSSIEQTIEVMCVADDLNLVGKKTIALAIEQKIISGDNVRKIGEIPFAHATGMGG